MNEKPEARMMQIVKLGPKGQLVIPKEVRELFGLQTGDRLLLLADKERGIALQSTQIMSELADSIFRSETDERTKRFAAQVQKTLEEDGHERD